MADVKQSMMAFLARRTPGAAAQKPAGSALMRFAPTGLMILLVALAGWLGAEWFWYYQSDSAVRASAPVRKIDLNAAANALAAAQPFGAATTPSVAAARTETISTLNIKLKGVFANKDKSAVAIFNNGQKDEYAKVGSEVAPGVVLDSVHPTHVLLKRGESLERVNLEERSSGNRPVLARPAPPRPIVPAPAQPAPPAPPVAQPGVPPGFPQGMNPSLPPMQLPPGVPGMPGQIPGQQGQTANQFGQLANTRFGVRVEAAPPGSVLEKIGLQAGDVIRTINGQQIQHESDLARIYQQTSPGATVMAEVSRAGKSVPIQVVR